MPKDKPEWAFVPEADEMVAKLVAKYPEKFGHIDPARVGCCMICGKEPPEAQDWDCQIGGVREPFVLFSTKTYLLWFFKCTWERYNKRQRCAMLFRQMVRISEEFDGKLLKEDLHDCRCLVKAFGVSYMDNPNLPDLVEEKQVL